MSSTVRPAGRRERRPVAVLKGHDAGAAPPEVAQGTHRKSRDQECQQPVLDRVGQRVEVGDAGRIGNVRAREHLPQETRLPRELGEVAQGDGRTQQAQHRDQQGDPIEPGQRRAVPRLQAPREVQPDTGMHPDGEGQRELPREPCPGSGDQRAQDPSVARLDVVEQRRAARAHDMHRSQRHDRAAQRELRPLPAREAQRAASEHRPERQCHVQREPTIERGLADRIVPQHHEQAPSLLERAQRYDAERVVHEMRRDIDQQDIARPESQPADHRLTPPAPAPLRAVDRQSRACPPRRSAVAAESDAPQRPSRRSSRRDGRAQGPPS